MKDGIAEKVAGVAEALGQHIFGSRGSCGRCQRVLVTAHGSHAHAHAQLAFDRRPGHHLAAPVVKAKTKSKTKL